MLLPRALQLRQCGVSAQGGAASTKPIMSTTNVDSLVVTYLRKRGLANTLKAFIAETSFKDAKGAVAEDLEAIYGNYLSTNRCSKKRKIQDGAAESLVKKTKPVASSSSEDSESGSEEEEQAKPAEVVVAKSLSKAGSKAVANGESKKVAAKPTRAEKDVTAGKTQQAKVSVKEEEPSSSSDESEDEPAAVKKTVPVSVASKVKPEPSSSSDDSDSGSEEEEKAKPAEVVVAKTLNKARSKAVVNGESKRVAAKQTPAEKDVTVGKTQQAKVSVKEEEQSSSSDESEDEPAAVKKTVPVPVASKVNPEPPSSSDDSESGSEEEEQAKPAEVVVGKTLNKAGSKAVANGESKKVAAKPSPAVKDVTAGKTQQAKVLVKEEESSSSSDESDDEPAAVKKTVPVPVASNVKPEPSSDDSDCSSEEDEEPVKAPVAKIPVKDSKITSKQVAANPNPASSSSSEDSDSEDEAPLKKTTQVVIAKSLNKAGSKAVAIGESKRVAAKQTPAEKDVTAGKSQQAKVLVKEEESSSSSDESDDEPAAVKKTVPVPVALSVKPEPSSSSDDSDSGSEEDEKPVKAPVARIPITESKILSNQVAAKPTPASSSSSEDTDSEEEAPSKKTTQVVIAKSLNKAGSKVVANGESKKVAAKPTPAEKDVTAGKSQQAKVLVKEEESSSSSDESDDEPAAVKKTVPVPVALSVKPEPSSSSDDSDSGSEEDEKPVNASVISKKDSPEKKVVLKKADKKTNAVQPSSSDDSDSSSEDEGKPAQVVAKVEEEVVVPVEKQAALPVSGKPNKNSMPAKETSERKRKRETTKPSELAKVDDTKNGSTDAANGTPEIQEKNGAAAKRQKLSHVQEGAPKFFQKIDVNEVEYADPRLQDNSYWAKNGADEGWGAKAQQILGQVKGKGFRHEKTKKKRGSYKGGVIDFSSHSIKFKDSDEE